MPSQSFYKSKSDWQRIIDSTWGPGLPLSSKLAIFDSYTATLTSKFDGFLSLGINWDSVKSSYRSRIDASTSRGKFAGIMTRLALILRDAHTWAWDTVVTNTPPAPGVPLMILSPFATAEHFGAVLTALPDSTALVLRVVKNHPLGLEPGDVVLGYEGVEWKRLVEELFDAGLPVNSIGVGSRSAAIHARIRNVGNNWHLFDTIDIAKHTTKQVVHLPVAPLLTLPPIPMMGNEQIEIAGIPFAQFWTDTYPGHGQPVSYGIIPGTETGYIQLVAEWPTNTADQMFRNAVTALWNMRGLIIDMRWNNGGWALFDAAFRKMFSQTLSPIEDAARVSPTSFALTPKANSSLFAIPGTPGLIYDRPIAVILGPTCVSMGDVTAQRLKYHPMVRFFGRAPIASLGDNAEITGFADWWLHYSFTDMFHTSQPGVYLNRKEFPIDETAWFTPEEVAAGKDGVLELALHWIYTIAYGCNVKLAQVEGDSLCLTANVRNPLVHSIVVMGTLSDSVGALIDSVVLKDDGQHGDGLAGDSLWGGWCRTQVRGIIHTTLRTTDLTTGTSRTLPDVALLNFTTGLIVESDDLPHEFSLGQNYPNPFNPSTTIRYGLPIRSHVTLTIFNTLAQQVAVLHDGEQEAGYHDVKFDGKGLSSGMYFYRLRAGDFVDTRRLLLLR
jgi:hypothetical protein